MSKKENIIQKVTQWRDILAIQVIASLILIGLLFKLGALPMLYAIIVIILVALLNVGIFFLMKPSKNKKKGKVRTVIGKFVSILLSVLLLVGSLYIAQGNSLIDAITGANTETTRISVVVMEKSKYKELSDLKGETIEVNMSAETEKMEEAIKSLKNEESSIKTKEVDEFAKMADDLYKGTTNAIFVNEAYYAMLEANHPNFETETRVIWYKDITVKTNDISKNVDVTKEPFVVYISGIDTYGKVSTVSRTDVNMIVTVNPKTKQILMTSIPRDYYVTLANKGKKDKLTHSGLGGIENTVKTMENFMGIDINYYARVNFTSLIKMVDALGGVDVDSIEAFSTGTYSFKKGTNHVNGEQALAFSRERYHVTGGDNGRVANQQRVLTAMLKKMMSPAIITNYSSVLNSINGSFETNMESGDITGLLQMQISDMASWTIIQKQLTGTGKTMTGGAYMPNNKLYYMIPNDSSVAENKQAIQNVLDGKPVS
ncbi:MAG: LCP family protein [Thomasclavelia sp.]|uniref:LCP family protein n=1 Tax=Thomasclavelia sp. TaxID=3025757 RepID=UPI00399FEB57